MWTHTLLKKRSLTDDWIYTFARGLRRKFTNKQCEWMNKKAWKRKIYVWHLIRGFSFRVFPSLNESPLFLHIKIFLNKIKILLIFFFGFNNRENFLKHFFFHNFDSKYIFFIVYFFLNDNSSVRIKCKSCRQVLNLIREIPFTHHDFYNIERVLLSVGMWRIIIKITSDIVHFHRAHHALISSSSILRDVFCEIYVF